MPTREISKVNYNGTEYIIVDSTADEKFSALGHQHTAADIIGGVDTVDYLTISSVDYPIVSRRKGVLSPTASDITGVWIDYTINNTTQSIFLYDSAAIAYLQTEISNDIATAKAEAIADAALKYSSLGHKHDAGDITGTLTVSHGGTGVSTTSKGAFHATSNGGTPLFGTLPVDEGGTGVTTITSGEVVVGNGTNAISTKAIDTTTGGTVNSGDLISSGAVYAGLAGKTDVGHKHPVADITGVLTTSQGGTGLSTTSAGALYATTDGGSLQYGVLPVAQGGTGVSTITSGQVLVGNGTNAIGTKSIDTTTGGTSSSSDLITSGAVYAGLSEKTDVGHKHGMSDITDGVQGIYYVMGTQTAKTGNWTGTLSTVAELYDGLTIAYYLPQTGSGNASLTLTMGNGVTSAIPVYYTGTTRTTTHYAAGSVILLTYVNNAWRRADYDSNSNTVPASHCATASGTAAKTATHTYYTAKPNSYTLVTTRYSNTASSALTLNINSVGAKPIYINGAPSSSTNYTLPAGTYLVYYDGTNYYFRTDGKIPGDIAGNAETVNGFTVATDVPGNAKFTDTTYTFDVNSGLTTSGTDVSIGTVPVSHGGTGTTSLASGQVLIGNGTNTVSTRGIDTTNGGTANSTSLITSGAVYAGLEGKSPVAHKHSIANGDITDLAFDGTYDKTDNKAATVATVNTAVSSITPESLGLSKALKFIGIATSTMSDSQTTIPTISGLTTYTPAVGDVVIDSGSQYEYVYTSANMWEQLGSDVSYAVSGTTISYTPAGTISDNGSTVNYTPSGSINTQTFHGASGAVNVTGMTDGTVTISTASTGTVNYTPAGSVTASFSGITGELDVQGSTDGVSADPHSYTPEGTITSTSSGTKNYTPEGSVTLSGVPTEINVSGTASGTITITSTTSGTINYTPAGTVTGSLVGTSTTITLTGGTSGVGVSNHSYTPAGSITATTTTVSSNYTPGGQVALSGVPSEISVSGVTDGDVTIASTTTTVSSNYTPKGTITNATFSGSEGTVNVSGSVDGITLNNITPDGSITSSSTGTVNYTPTGTIEASFAGSSVEFSGTFTPTGSVSKPNITVTTTTVAADDITGWDAGSMFSTTISGEKIVLNDGATPTLTYTSRTVVTSVSAALASTPTFTATAQDIAVSGTPNGTITATFHGDGTHLAFSGTSTTPTIKTYGSVTASGKFTPSGSVTASFSGTAARFTAAFTGKSISSTGTFPSITAAFTGSAAKFDFTGSTTTLQHSVQQGDVLVSGDYTPTGTLSAVFSGTGAVLSGSFSGTPGDFSGSFPTITAAFVGTATHLKFSGTATSLPHNMQQGTVTASGSFTPEGTITNAVFTGSGAVLTASFVGKQIAASGSFTPTGTIDAAVFSGTGAKLKFTGTATQLTIV